MSGWNKWAWAALYAAIAAAPATAQTGGINSGGQTGGVGLGGGSNALSSGSSGTGSSGTGLGSSTGNGAGGVLQPTMLNSNGYSKPTGTANSSLSSDNFLSGYYANPYYSGFGTSFKTAPGGFGSPLYTSSSGTSTSTTGARGGTRTTGTTGVGRTGLTGTTANQSGIVVPLPVQINYTAQMQFSTPAIAPGRIQSDIRAAVDNSSMITSAKNVEITTDTNNNITLRGKVKDESEARLIEGVIRLTPGVGEIRNELLFPLP